MSKTVKSVKEEIAEHNVEFKAETLASDVRDFLIGTLKGFAKNYDAMLEDEQKKTVAILEQESRKLIKNVISTISGYGHNALSGTISSVNIKSNNIEFKISVPKSEDAGKIAVEMDTIKNVTIAGISESEFDKAQRDAAIKPDQATIIDGE